MIKTYVIGASRSSSLKLSCYIRSYLTKIESSLRQSRGLLSNHFHHDGATSLDEEEFPRARYVISSPRARAPSLAELKLPYQSRRLTSRKTCPISSAAQYETIDGLHIDHASLMVQHTLAGLVCGLFLSKTDFSSDIKILRKQIAFVRHIY